MRLKLKPGRFNYLLLPLMLLLSRSILVAQFTFVYDNSIPVYSADGKSLDMPWTGGVNGTQFNTIDLDEDGKEDLVLFDRMANQVITFLNRDKRYIYAPEYEVYFPTAISNWLLLKDFNCDGKKDIFTGDALGMKVYQNISTPEEGLKWKQFMFYTPFGKSDVALTMGFTQKINIQLQYDDLPALYDADNDGDLDIYKIAFTGNGAVEYHQNLSMERYGTCDSLDFVRQTQSWGKVTQCLCDNFAYDGKECFTSGGRVQHAGGKALLAIDLDNDKDNELILSEANCNNLYLLTNLGNNANPVITSASLYPNEPTDINVFPAAFYEDVDFDGRKDLIATPNVYRKDLLDMDLKASTWFYKNTGSKEIPHFTFVKNDFLQDQMIDVGDNAVPAFADEDGDGDLDLFIGYNSDVSSLGSINFFKNTGTSTSPEFQFVTDDYSGIKSLNMYNIRPQLVDMNGDGRVDIVLSGTDSAERTWLYSFFNTKNGGMQFDLNDRIIIPITLGARENYHVTDINEDGKPDILIGRFVGALEYWRNYGTPSMPQFSLENPAYLNISNNVQRLGMTCFSTDLDGDYKQDLIIADAFGKISIINNFHEVNDYSEEKSNVVFNSLINGYQSISLGKAWPTAARLFDSKRPAIIVGTIRGGLEVLRNEEKEPQFDELNLTLYPNPVRGDRVVSVETNMPLSLQVYTLLGQHITDAVMNANEMNMLRFESLAPGLYIFKFSSESQSIFRRVIFE